MIDASKDNNFQECIEQFGGLGLGSRSFLIYQPAPDDATDFEICGFYKNTRILKSWERNIIFSSNKKSHQVHIKGYFMTKNSFAAEVTFKIPSWEAINNSCTAVLCT